MYQCVEVQVVADMPNTNSINKKIVGWDNIDWQALESFAIPFGNVGRTEFVSRAIRLQAAKAHLHCFSTRGHQESPKAPENTDEVLV